MVIWAWWSTWRPLGTGRARTLPAPGCSNLRTLIASACSSVLISWGFRPRGEPHGLPAMGQSLERWGWPSRSALYYDSLADTLVLSSSGPRPDPAHSQADEPGTAQPLLRNEDAARKSPLRWLELVRTPMARIVRFRPATLAKPAVPPACATFTRWRPPAEYRRHR